MLNINVRKSRLDPSTVTLADIENGTWFYTLDGNLYLLLEDNDGFIVLNAFSNFISFANICDIDICDKIAIDPVDVTLKLTMGNRTFFRTILYSQPTFFIINKNPETIYFTAGGELVDITNARIIDYETMIDILGDEGEGIEVTVCDLEITG